MINSTVLTVGGARPQTLAVEVADPLTTLRQVYLAAVTLLVWDWLLTSDREVNFVWPRRWSIGKVLFLLNRYLFVSFIILDTTFYFQGSWLPLSSCRAYHLLSDTMNTLTLAVSQSILAVRTYAMYQTRWCYCLLLFLVTVPAAVTITFVWYEVLTVEFYVMLGDVCLPTCSGSALCQDIWYVAWGYNLGVDTCIVLLTLYQFWKKWNPRRTVLIGHGDFSTMRAYPRSSFLNALFRDGFLYYFVIAFVAAVNLIVMLTDLSLLPFFLSLSRSLQTISCSRLFLNLRLNLDEPEPEIGADDRASPSIELTPVNFSRPTNLSSRELISVKNFDYSNSPGRPSY